MSGLSQHEVGAVERLQDSSGYPPALAQHPKAVAGGGLPRVWAGVNTIGADSYGVASRPHGCQRARAIDQTHVPPASVEGRSRLRPQAHKPRTQPSRAIWKRWLVFGQRRRAELASTAGPADYPNRADRKYLRQPLVSAGGADAGNPRRAQEYHHRQSADHGVGVLGDDLARFVLVHTVE